MAPDRGRRGAAPLTAYLVQVEQRFARLWKGWRHRRIVLKSDSNDPGFEPIVLENMTEDEIQVVAELVEVLD